MRQRLRKFDVRMLSLSGVSHPRLRHPMSASPAMLHLPQPQDEREPLLLHQTATQSWQWLSHIVG